MKVAIIGFGPKGLFALERLLDRLRSVTPGHAVDIDVFERHPVPGAGPVYDPGQPSYLLMNFPGSKVDAWHPESRLVPPQLRQSFSRWRELHIGGSGAEYPPRAEVGRYLADSARILFAHAPADARVAVHQREVSDLRRRGDGWNLLGHRGESFGPYDEVLLASGHRFKPAAIRGTPAASQAPVLPSVFPVSGLSAERVPAGSSVGIRGFALTFIDAALSLTEGRGGSFADAGGGRLAYIPGPEAVKRIVPFSRRGRPPLAKPPVGDELASSSAALSRRIRDAAGPLEPVRDLVPVLADAASAARPGPHSEATEALLAACAGRPPTTGLGARDELASSIEIGTGRARPDLQAALGAAWRAIYPALVEKGRAGGIASSGWATVSLLATEMERLAFGPPPVNAAKLLALIDAEVVDLAAARGGAAAILGGAALVPGGAGLEVDVVIDAVLPGPGVDLRAESLESRIVASGAARVAGGRRGIEVGTGGACVSADGTPTPGLSAIGRPTEDWVIGNDTLDRSLHTEADDWAKRLVSRLTRRGVEDDRAVPDLLGAS